MQKLEGRVNISTAGSSLLELRLLSLRSQRHRQCQNRRGRPGQPFSIRTWSLCNSDVKKGSLRPWRCRPAHSDEIGNTVTLQESVASATAASDSRHTGWRGRISSCGFRTLCCSNGKPGAFWRWQAGIRALFACKEKLLLQKLKSKAKHPTMEPGRKIQSMREMLSVQKAYLKNTVSF
ncbi:hypothetical protein lerEdw1_009983 [Lerista edwardsae]|nr:hypothetical protein lerEdw1_009983 [Lerista edwardsae]